jgi:GPH family glycoside/pentoside/hexuronide:cation symporter
MDWAVGMGYSAMVLIVMYDPKWFPSADVATRTLAIWVGVIFMICAMMPAFY